MCFSEKQLVLAEKLLKLHKTPRNCSLAPGAHKNNFEKFGQHAVPNFHMTMWKTFSLKITKHHRSTYLDLQVPRTDVSHASANHGPDKSFLCVGCHGNVLHKSWENGKYQNMYYLSMFLESTAFQNIYEVGSAETLCTTTLDLCMYFVKFSWSLISRILYYVSVPMWCLGKRFFTL